MARRCLKCNYLNPKEATRCEMCGSPLGQICPSCGTPLSPGTRRCPKCQNAGPSDAELFAQIFQSTPQKAIKGRYTIVKTLSRGRVSTVYRVRDMHAEGASYALKEFNEIALLTGEEKKRARDAFQSQVERWSHLQHRNLPKILDVFSVGDKHYVLMPLIIGLNLAQIIQSPSVEVTEEQAANWGAQLCDLLEYLHRQDPPLLLGELKPEHVMVTKSGLVQLVDFNLTRPFMPERESDLRYAPPTAYVAPELHSGVWTPASDLYSLGMLLYALLARRLLSPASRMPTSLRQALPTVSRRMETVLVRATRRDPAARFASAADFREALWGAEPIPLQPLQRAAAAPEPQPLPGAMPGRRGAERTAPSPLPAAPRAATAQPGLKPRLLVRPRRLEVENLRPEEHRPMSLTLFNAGDGMLEGRLVSQVAWITVRNGAFQCAPRQSCEVSLMVWGKRLPLGGASDPQALLVDSNAGRQWVSAEAKMPVAPALTLSPELLDFGDIQDTKEVTGHLTVTNSGGGMLKGTVRSRVNWLFIPNPDFVCAPQRAAQIQVLLRPRLLSPGTREENAALVVDSDAGQVRVSVRVRRLQPLLAVTPLNLDFGAARRGEVVERTLTLLNEGSGTLDYMLTSREPWLRVSPKVGSCSERESCPAVLTVDTATLPEGETVSAAALLVQSNAGGARIGARIATVAPQLVVDSEWLDLGETPPGQPARAALTLRNAGSAPLHVQLSSRVPWLYVNPAELTIEPRHSASVQMIADTASYSRGQVLELPEALQIASDGGERLLPLRLTLVQPALEVMPQRLDFGIVDRVLPARARLVIRNRDTGLLEWKIETRDQWIELLPRQGVTRAGQEFEVEVVAYGLALPGDSENVRGLLRVVSNGGAQDVPLSLTLASPRLDIDVSVVALGASVNYAPVEGSFLIFNHGLGTLRGSVQTRSARLTAEPATFEVAMGRPQVIVVRAQSEGLPAGPVEEREKIVVESNGGRAELDVRYDIVLKPEIEVSLPILEAAPDAAPDAPTKGKLTLKNVGHETAQVTLTPSSPRLSVTRRSYTIKPGKSINLEVTASAEAEPEALYIEITVQGETQIIPVQVQAAGQ